MAPPKTSVDEFDALAALDRLHLDAADAKLAVTAGLFLVLASTSALPRMVSPVRDFGRLQSEIDVIALMELGNDDFDVLLARNQQAGIPWSADRVKTGARDLPREFYGWRRRFCLHQRGFRSMAKVMEGSGSCAGE